MLHITQIEIARFTEKVDFISAAPCYIWLGKSLPRGYGQHSLYGRMWLAHRLSYEINVGPIPEGLDIHHTCHTTSCVNPMHLEAVTRSANHFAKRLNPDRVDRKRSKKACPLGHPYEGENVYITKRGYQMCKQCLRDRARERARDARRAAGVPIKGSATHCKRGHEFTEENTIVTTRGRKCRTCHNARMREYHHRKKQRESHNA